MDLDEVLRELADHAKGPPRALEYTRRRPPSLPLEEWQGFVLVSLDPRAEPLADRLAERMAGAAAARR